MQPAIRLLPYADADGSHNMAADEAMVHAAALGVASLRVYGWTTATVSLGYFQPAAVRLAEPRLADLPWVRRPSGGATLLHHHELTYAIALPAGREWQESGPWPQRMHRIIAAALEDLGLDQRVQTAGPVTVRHGAVLCFQQFTAGDLLCLGKKVVGSAQRKHRQALLQHGSILLAQSQFTPDLLGVFELTGVHLSTSEMRAAFLTSFALDTGWSLDPRDWTDAEKAAIEESAIQKYGNSSWNERR